MLALQFFWRNLTFCLWCLVCLPCWPLLCLLCVNPLYLGHCFSCVLFLNPYRFQKIAIFLCHSFGRTHFLHEIGRQISSFRTATQPPRCLWTTHTRELQKSIYSFRFPRRLNPQMQKEKEVVHCSSTPGLEDILAKREHESPLNQGGKQSLGVRGKISPKPLTWR